MYDSYGDNGDLFRYDKSWLYWSLDRIKNTYVRKWPQKYPKPGKAKSHSDKINFDNGLLNFISLLGAHYNKNVYGLENPVLLEAFWEALLEKAALECYKSCTIKQFTQILCYMTDRAYRFNKHQPDVFIWKLGQLTDEGFITLLRHFLTISRHDAMATLQALLGYSFSNLTQFTSKSYPCESSNNYISQNIPYNLTVREGTAVIRHIHLLNKIDVYGYSQQIIGTILNYEWGKARFCLSASAVNGELCLGKHPSKAFLLNEDLLDLYPNAIALFFQDMRVAIAVNEKLKILQPGINNRLIVTACLSTELNLIEWPLFTGRDVYFVPVFVSAYIAMLSEYKKYISGSSARFCICRNLFSTSKPSKEKLAEVGQENGVLKEFVNNAVWIVDSKNIYQDICNSLQNSREYESFEKWGADLGIYKRKALSTNTEALLEPGALPNAPEYMRPPRANTFDAVNFWNTFKAGNYVLIIGLKGAGKTQLVLAICHQILHKGTRWPLFANNHEVSDNICILDGETPQDEVDANLAQYGLASYANKRLFYLSLLGDNQPEFLQGFSLAKEECQNSLLHYLVQNKCRFLVLDSLTFLTRNNPNARYADVVNFINILQGKGICVVLTNHKNANDSDKIWAKQEYYNRARVIINMHNKVECAEFEASIKSLEVASKMPGLTVGLEFEHHKTAPCLEEKIFFFHLDPGSSDWQYLGQHGCKTIPTEWLVESISSDTGKNEESGNSQPVKNLPKKAITQKVNDLPPRLRQVYDAFRDYGKPATREELEKITGLEKDVLLKMLKELIASGFVIKEGDGKGTYYRPVV